VGHAEDLLGAAESFQLLADGLRGTAADADVNFVEDQEGVDYVTDFQVFHDVNGVLGSSDLDEVAGSTAVSILVSAAASKHSITVIKPALESAPAETCPCET